MVHHHPVHLVARVMIFRLPPLLVTFLVATCIGGAGVAMTVMVPRNRVVMQQAVMAQVNSEFDDRWNESQSVLKKQDRLDIAPRPTRQVPEIQPEPKADPVEIVHHDERKPIVGHKPKRERERNVCSRHGMHKVYTRSGRSWRCRR